MKKYIKMNDCGSYLSLGNIFTTIKNIASNKNTAMQTELFCTFFNTNNINNTTVNNYCIGYRAIGLEYKKMYSDKYIKYKKDNCVFYNMMLNLISILDEHIYKSDIIDYDLINNNKKLNEVITNLLKIVDNDFNITDDLHKKIQDLYDENNLYACFIEMLTYAILYNKQPIYNNNIEIDIKDNELIEYLKINLYEGISYITSLKELSKKGNKYANAELGSLAFSGILNNKKDYLLSYKYYLASANKNHPKGCWMVANLILTNRVGSIKKDFNTLWKYLNKAVELGSIAALNTMGNCYLNGINPNKEIDVEKAIKYYLDASEYGYVYSYNNLGKIYEKNNDFDKSFEYYKLSADLNESWALNKVGEILRKQGNLKDAYIYYKKAIEAPLSERNFYSYYNLAKYYYSCGCKELGIEKDDNKSNEYFRIAEEHGIN